MTDIDRESLESEMRLLKKGYYQLWNNDELAQELIDNIFSDIRLALDRNEGQRIQESGVDTERETVGREDENPRRSSSSLFQLSASGYLIFSFGLMAGFGAGYANAFPIVSALGLADLSLLGVAVTELPLNIIVGGVIGLFLGLVAMILWNWRRIYGSDIEEGEQIYID